MALPQAAVGKITPSAQKSETAGLFARKGKKAAPSEFDRILSSLLGKAKNLSGPGTKSKVPTLNQPKAGKAGKAELKEAFLGKAPKSDKKPALVPPGTKAPDAASLLAVKAGDGSSVGAVKAEKKPGVEAKKTDAPTAKDANAKKKPAKSTADEDGSAASLLASLAGTAGTKPKTPVQAKDGPKDGAAPVDEKKKDDKKSPAIAVVDMRTKASLEKKIEPVDAPKKGEGDNVRDMTISLRDSGGQKADKAEVVDAKPQVPESSFAKELSRTLREGANGDIVKTGMIVLKNDDSGLIRLSLKPESLGNVKIRLKVSDNNITGTITVDSQAAKAAFDENLPQLQQAFVQSGFGTASLDVAVSYGNAGEQGRDRGDQNGKGAFYSERSKSFEAQLPQAAAAYGHDGSLNMII